MAATARVEDIYVYAHFIDVSHGSGRNLIMSFSYIHEWLR